MSLRCVSCLAANPDGNRFCEDCGAGLSLVCRHCGQECGPSARFCGACGAPQNAGVPAATTIPAASAWGELKQATVLFADIVSSTEQIADLDAEQAMERLGPALARMCESVEKFDGTVVRTLGDGVMAIFGAPKALEGHALLACEAALDMQQTFAADGQGLRIRVGLHSGQVASDPRHADGKGGGAHGLTIHLASRVVGLADPGGICLTESCYVLVRSLCEVQPMGEHILKGISGQSGIYALTGLKTASAAQHFHQSSLTLFLGRDREIDLLKEALRVTERGQARVVGISGEPGAGKSRLCHEFVQWCRARQVPVFEVRAQPYGHATPLQPGLSLLRTFFFRILPSDDASVARGRIVERMTELGPLAETDLALLYEFLGVAQANSLQSMLSPKARHLRLLNIMRELIKHDAGVTSVILIEDLHWLDEASEEFVATLVEAAAGTQTMVVLNYRFTYRLPWTQSENFQKIELKQLTVEETEHLVRSLVGPRQELQQICELVVKRSAGNPFFAEELVRSLAYGGFLSDDPGLRAGGMDEIERALPATVQAVIGARLDRLGEPEKTLLQMCAIIGKEIPLAVLEHMASPLASVIEKGLDGLCHAELILPQPAMGGRRFTFRHPLIQEVAYSTQLKVRRGSLHSAVAIAMEAYYAEQLDEYAGLIAYHYEAAGRTLDAASYAARAARWVGSTDSAQAIKHWRKVRVLLQGQPRSAQVDSLRALAGGRIVYLGWREGLGLEEVQLLIQEAMELASEVDIRLVQLLLFAHGRMLQSSGGPADGYVESIMKALTLPTAGTDAGRIATLNLALSHAYAWAGLLREGLAANDLALQGLKSIDTFDREFIGFSIEQWALSIRIRLLNRMGRFDEAQTYLQQMPADADLPDDPVMRQIAHHVYVDLAWCKNDAALARKHAAAVADIAEKHQNPYSKIFALSCNGLSHLTGQDYEGAKQMFVEALKLIESTRVAVDFEAEMLVGLAECEQRLGNFEQALVFAREALAVSKQRSNRLAECRALIVWGSVLVADNEPANAELLFEQARQLIDLTGVQIFETALKHARVASLPIARLQA